MTTITLTATEQANAKNLDVAWLQKWLNAHGASLVVDGNGGSLTRAAIIQVFVNKSALAITQEQLQSIARDLGDSNTQRINAVAKVESAGGGWFQACSKFCMSATSFGSGYKISQIAWCLGLQIQKPGITPLMATPI